jgi:hypothetical protein
MVMRILAGGFGVFILMLILMILYSLYVHI